MKRERLGSRLGFILLSAGCAIGCGNVWKFPWLTGQNGGGGFVLLYILCLVLLGVPVMTMELALGRASQASPVGMYQKLEKPGHKWHLHGYLALLGNVSLLTFYSVVAGWMVYYFCSFLLGQHTDLGFDTMISNPRINAGFLLIVMVLASLVLCFHLQSGLERVTTYMMCTLFALMVVLAIRSCALSGAPEGLRFFLLPDLNQISGSTVVTAMNQAFFTLSLGMGSMAIFGSYIDKDRALLGEAIHIIALDTFVAVTAGLIIFPVCFTYHVEVSAGPSLLFDTMTTIFNNMAGGRWWGTLFFLFMIFAAMSTVLAIFENILACVRELTGWSRAKGSLICGIALFLTALTTAFGFNIWSGFQPFGPGTTWMDLWTFLVENIALPVGSLIFALFCCNQSGWGWHNFIAEANTGTGLKIQRWMRPFMQFMVPTIITFLFFYSLISFISK